jgi:hypothetical protein
MKNCIVAKFCSKTVFSKEFASSEAADRVTRRDCEKIAQNVAQPFLSKLVHNFYCRKKIVQNFGDFGD